MLGSLVIRASSAKGSRKFTLRSKARRGKEPEMPWMLPRVLWPSSRPADNDEPRYAALAPSNVVAILVIECRPHASTRNSPSIPALRAGALAGWLAPLSVPRIERVAQAVADEIERQHQQKNRQTRPYRHPRRVVDVVLGGVEHAAPRGSGRLLTEPQK